MFSTMMTDESTMMPKSTAPIDSRLADLPRRNSTEKANSSASGMLMATISAVRTLLRNMSRMTVTRPMPTSRFSVTVSVVTWSRSVAVVVGLDLDAGQHPAGGGIVELLDLGLRRPSGRAACPRSCAAARCTPPCRPRRGRRRRGVSGEPGGPLAVGLPIADPPQPRLVADDDALVRSNWPGETRPPSTTSSTRTGWLLTEVITRRRMSRMRRCSSARRMAAAATGFFSPSTLFTGSMPAAEQADAAHRHGDLALVDVVAAHGGVAVGQRGLQAGRRVMP